MKALERRNVLARLALAGTGLLLCVSATGCQVDVGGQTLPSPWYLTDDIQYFPAGPEFKLSREAAAIQEAKAREKRRRLGLPEAEPLPPGRGGVAAPVPEGVIPPGAAGAAPPGAPIPGGAGRDPSAPGIAPVPEDGIAPAPAGVIEPSRDNTPPAPVADPFE